MLENTSEIIDNPTKKFINNQLDIKLGQFMVEELDTVLKKISKQKYGSQGNLMTCFFDYATLSINKTREKCILHFPKKIDLRITKNYRSITLTAIAAKVSNALLLNCIQPQENF